MMLVTSSYIVSYCRTNFPLHSQQLRLREEPVGAEVSKSTQKEV